MKYLLIIFSILYTCLIKAELMECKYSPVTLSNTEDWNKFKIQKWHNCFGELYQNYNNKKKWSTFFKNGLPNGYGIVTYDNLDGYFEGYFLNGKIHGEVKFIYNNGEKLDLECLHNSCKRLKKSISQNKDLKSDNFSDIEYNDIETKQFTDYKKNFYKPNKFYKTNNQSSAFSNNLKINNIPTSNEIMNINKFILNNQTKSLVQSKNIISSDKVFKYIK